jgi:hypothetical protein
MPMANRLRERLSPSWDEPNDAVSDHSVYVWKQMKMEHLASVMYLRGVTALLLVRVKLEEQVPELLFKMMKLPRFSFNCVDVVEEMTKNVPILAQ